MVFSNKKEWHRKRSLHRVSCVEKTHLIFCNGINKINIHSFNHTDNSSQGIFISGSLKNFLRKCHGTILFSRWLMVSNSRDVYKYLWRDSIDSFHRETHGCETSLNENCFQPNYKKQQNISLNLFSRKNDGRNPKMIYIFIFLCMVLALRGIKLHLFSSILMHSILFSWTRLSSTFL